MLGLKLTNVSESGHWVYKIGTQHRWLDLDIPYRWPSRSRDNSVTSQHVRPVLLRWPPSLSTTVSRDPSGQLTSRSSAAVFKANDQSRTLAGHLAPGMTSDDLWWPARGALNPTPEKVIAERQNEIGTDKISRSARFTVKPQMNNEKKTSTNAKFKITQVIWCHTFGVAVHMWVEHPIISSMIKHIEVETKHFADEIFTFIFSNENCNSLIGSDEGLVLKVEKPLSGAYMRPAASILRFSVTQSVSFCDNAQVCVSILGIDLYNYTNSPSPYIHPLYHYKWISICCIVVTVIVVFKFTLVIMESTTIKRHCPRYCPIMWSFKRISL